MEGNILITKIDDVDSFFETNQNNIYIFKTLGIRSFDNEDDIGKQLQTLQLEYKFNVNEVIIFRTFYSSVILLYIPMECVLFYIRFEKPVINCFILIDNILIIYLEHEIRVINIKDLTTKALGIDKLTIELISKISLEFIKAPDKDQLSLTQVDELILKAPSNFTNSNNNIILKTGVKACERIWSVFILQTEPCYCISYVDKTRFFKYIINVNLEEDREFTLVELINFLQERFYSPLKYMTLLQTGE